MDDFFDEMDMELAMNNAPLQNYGGSLNPPTILDDDQIEQGPDPVEEEKEHRTISRCGVFNVTEDEEGFKVLDNGYLTIKEKIGTGGFCKVKKAVAQVNRMKKDELTGEETKVPGKQELAVKIFNRKFLKSQTTSEFDPETKCMKLSNHLNTIYSEISVWERCNHFNVVKIFELFDDSTVDEMYLMMELAGFG